jgi:hypothetical protein
LPGESLGLAERAVGSLLEGRLIVLLPVAPHDAHGHSDPGRGEAQVEEAELEPVLRSLDSWAEPGGSSGVRMRRA